MRRVARLATSGVRGRPGIVSALYAASSYLGPSWVAAEPALARGVPLPASWPSAGSRWFAAAPGKRGGKGSSSAGSSSGRGGSGTNPSVRGGPGPGPGAGSGAGSSSASSSSAGSTVRESSKGIEGDICMGMEHVSKTLPGGRVLFQDVSLSFYRGAKIGMLGLNGCGKSSLLKILAGADKEHEGKVWWEEGMRIGHLAQEPHLDPTKTVHENIMDGLREKTALLRRFEELSHAMADPDADVDKLLAEQAEVQAQIDLHDAWNLEHLIEIAKANLRVPPDDANVAGLSGGERRRVALCRLLLEQPDVLLLDEPTNHLDAESVKWLEEYLHAYKGSVIAITHDRYFLDNVAGWILEVDRGHCYAYAGNYSSWLEKKQTRLDRETKSDQKQARALEEELQWIRQGVKGRQKKSGARIAAFEKAQEEQMERRSAERFLSGAIAIPPGPRLGNVVLQVEHLKKTLPDGRTLVKDLSFDLPRGAIVGVVGANGTGKSTLMKMITGAFTPDSGVIRLGDTVVLGYVDQGRELDDGARVVDVISGGSDVVVAGDRVVPILAYMSKFNLAGSMANKFVRHLSGGERSRVHLARTLRFPTNFLILDEPTNDLDVDTLRSLEDAIQEYNGCAMIVSHDRFFLDRICTHTISFEGDGNVEYYPGCWSDYEEFKRRHLKHYLRDKKSA